MWGRWDPLLPSSLLHLIELSVTSDPCSFVHLQDMSMTGANIVESIALAASATASANGLGRVYTATSLPSHIWSFNGNYRTIVLLYYAILLSCCSTIVLSHNCTNVLSHKVTRQSPIISTISYPHTPLTVTLSISLSLSAGIKCPVCNKFVLPDDIECHLVMCLTKPRLSYNGMRNWIYSYTNINISIFVSISYRGYTFGRQGRVRHLS